MRFLRQRRLHFVGAGGVGMSGLAEILLLSTPLEISGCDLARSEKNPELKKNIVSKLAQMNSKDATDYLLELLK